MLRKISCFNCQNKDGMEILSLNIDYKKNQIRQTIYCPKCQTSEILVFSINKKKRLDLTIF